MRSVVASSAVFTSHSTWLKPLALVFHSHPIHGHAQRSLSVFSPSLSTSCSTSSSSFFLMTDGDSVTINHLCDSANGTFVTLDDYLSITGYEPNAMEFTGTTELNDAIFSDINFQDSLDYIAPSSDHYMDDDTLGMLLAEVHRDYADYRCAESVRVSPSSVSVMVDRTGEPVEEMITEERESSSAQIRTLLNEHRKRLSQSIARKFLITNTKQLEQNKNAKFYRRNNGVSNRIFVKFINKILQR